MMQVLVKPWGDRQPGSWWKSLLTCAFYLIAQFLIGMVLLRYGIRQLGLDPMDLTAEQLNSVIYLHPWSFVVAEAAGLVALFLGIGLFRFKLVDFKVNPWKLLGVSFVAYGVMYVYQEAYGWWMTSVNTDFVNTQNQVAIETTTQGTPFLTAFIGLGLLGPLVEELLFRGVIMKYLFPGLPWLGLVVSVVTFGMAHQPADILEWGLYAGMGTILGLTYLSTRKLEFAILLHIINNAVAVLLMYQI